ncbi:MAG: hypothetical protein LBJ11_03980 [Oscillospiraceae bacterium]|jgi:hypothetical protein|nr:hypothetical protein [Oscillospiraceae bacterium]
MNFSLTADEISFIDAALAMWPFGAHGDSEEEARKESAQRGFRVLAERRMLAPDAGDTPVKPLGDLAALVDTLKDLAQIAEFFAYSERAQAPVRVAALLLPRSEFNPAVSVTPNLLRLFEVESHSRDEIARLEAAFLESVRAAGSQGGYIERSYYADGKLTDKSRTN